VDNIMNLENLYGGTLSPEEIAGEPAGSGHQDDYFVTKRADREGDMTASAAALQRELLEPMSPAGTQATLRSTMKTTRKVGLDMSNANYEDSLKKSYSAPNFIKQNKQTVHEKSEKNVALNDAAGKIRFKDRDLSFLEGQEVYLYSSQKFNCTELQKEHMRSKMDPQQAERSWSYNEDYLSCMFEFSGAPTVGNAIEVKGKPNDTYSRLPQDERPVFRGIHPRDPEEFKKPDRGLGLGRADELHEAFVENEHFQLAIGVERRLPLAQHVRFEPDKVPHRRVISERPFDPSLIRNVGRPFGPRTELESVHYRSEGKLPEHRYAETLKKNRAAAEKEQSLMMQPRTHKTFSQGATRQCVTDLDRREVSLKDPPNSLKKFATDAPPLPVPSIAQTEAFHDRGRPDLEMQSRLRENDGSPPYNVQTGLYIPRDLEVGVKRACMSGTLGKAPWQHGSTKDLKSVPKGSLPGSSLARSKSQQTVHYMSSADFDNTRPPPQRKNIEAHIWKNASRSTLTKVDKSHRTFRRPADFGVQIAAL